MKPNWIFRIVLSPFALLYGLGVSFRNLMYQTKLLKSAKFSIPVISVGNLSVGGAGKTPHIEYLIELLRHYLNVATLSRGYKRETTGFLLAEPDMNAKTIGDEPLQYKRKFPQIEVAVAENRALGIPQLMAAAIETQVVLLDDAFQHRAVTPSLNIMLTEYSTPFSNDWLLPAGRLREWRSAYHRADVIIVSKCPAQMSEAEREKILKAIRPQPYQQVFFSYYAYEQMYYLFNRGYQGVLDKNTDVLLLSAIARTDYLMDYLETQAASVLGMEFEDHHYFTSEDLLRLNTAFLQLKSAQKIILTTEKDAMRLELHRAFLQEKQLPIFVLPVAVQFHFDEAERFNQLIKNHLLNFKV